MIRSELIYLFVTIFWHSVEMSTNRDIYAHVMKTSTGMEAHLIQFNFSHIQPKRSTASVSGKTIRKNKTKALYLCKREEELVFEAG